MSPAKIVPAPRECPGPEVCAPVQVGGHGWHVKKEVQLGHILTTLTIAVSAGLYVTKMDQRLAIVESTLAHGLREQHERDQRQDAAVSEASTLLRQQLSRMDEKLDRLIERQARAGK